MKKLIFILLLFPSLLFAQFDSPIYLEKDVTINYEEHYKWLVDYLTVNLDDIDDVNGETLFIIPIEREYKKKYKSRFINGYLAQYDWLPNGTDITVYYVKVKVWEFDFVQKKKNKKNLNNDDTCFDKPKKLKEKIKNKDKHHGKAHRFSYIIIDSDSFAGSISR